MSFKSIALGLLGALLLFGFYKGIWDRTASVQKFVLIFIVIEGIVDGVSILMARADD